MTKCQMTLDGPLVISDQALVGLELITSTEYFLVLKFTLRALAKLCYLILFPKDCHSCLFLFLFSNELHQQ